MKKFKVFECGGCSSYHPKGFIGDCRDDNNRFIDDDLDEKYGFDNWKVVPEEDAQRVIFRKWKAKGEVSSRY